MQPKINNYLISAYNLTNIMKFLNQIKVTIIFILVITTLSNVFSQVSLGIKFGSNWSTVTNANSENSKELNRSNVFGIVSSYKLNNNLSLNNEVIYSVKGYIQNDSHENFSQKFNMNYLELPLLIRYNIGNKDLKYFLNIGPYVAYWLNGYSSDNYSEHLETQNYDFKSIYSSDNKTIIKDNRTDYGMILGAGITYAFGHGNIILDARYDYSLTNNNKYSGHKPVDWKNNSNRTFSITAGYMLSLEK